MDNEDKYVASIEPYILNKILTSFYNDGVDTNIIEYLNNGNLIQIKQLPYLYTNYVKQKSTNIDALKIMNNNKINHMVVVDDEFTITGILSREHIIGKILLQLAQNK